MNAKLCKALRRQAFKETVGLPLRRMKMARGKKITAATRGFVINDPKSFRGRYRALKKLARATAKG